VHRRACKLPIQMAGKKSNIWYILARRTYKAGIMICFIIVHFVDENFRNQIIIWCVYLLRLIMLLLYFETKETAELDIVFFHNSTHIKASLLHTYPFTRVFMRKDSIISNDRANLYLVTKTTVFTTFTPISHIIHLYFCVVLIS
jgi:hypothetical protein